MRIARRNSHDDEIARNITYEKLRKILSDKTGRSISLEDAREIGDDLIEFYTKLAGGRKIIMENTKQSKSTRANRSSNNFTDKEADKNVD